MVAIFKDGHHGHIGTFRMASIWETSYSDDIHVCKVEMIPLHIARYGVCVLVIPCLHIYSHFQIKIQKQWIFHFANFYFLHASQILIHIFHLYM